MSEVGAHLSEARRFLEAARSDLRRRDYKRAVSSAYYCAFHATKALLLTERISPRTHEGLLHKFNEIFVKGKGFSRELGLILKDLKRRRELSDYVPGSEFSRSDAIEAIQMAERFLACIEEWLG